MSGWDLHLGGDQSSAEDLAALVPKVEAFLADVGATWHSLSTDHGTSTVELLKNVETVKNAAQPAEVIS